MNPSAFLDEARELLHASIDEGETVRSLARFVVARLADGCTVDLLRADGARRREALVVRDARRAAAMAELSARLERAGEAPRDDAHTAFVGFTTVPLRSGAHTLGVLTVAWVDAAPSAELVSHLTELGRLAGTALGHAAAHRRVTESARHLRKLQALTARLLAATSYEKARSSVLAETIAVLEADGGALMILSDDERSLHVLEASGYAPGLLRPIATFDVSAPFAAAEAFRTGRPQVFHHAADLIARFSGARHAVSASGHESFVYLPLVLEKKRIGTLGVTAVRPYAFEGMDEELFVLLGQACALALDRGRLFDAESAARAEAVAAERRWHDLLRDAPVAVAVVEGPSHRFVFANTEYERLVGNDALVGHTLREALPAVAEQGVGPVFDAVYASGRPERHREFRTYRDWRRTGSAEERFFDFAVQPRRNANGEVFGLMAVVAEVTDRVRARKSAERMAEERAELLARERAARSYADEQLARIHTLFMQAPAAISVVRGPELRVELANEPFRRLVGAHGELEGLPLDVAVPDLEPSLRALLANVMTTGQRFVGNELPLRLAPGGGASGGGVSQERYFDVVFEPTRDLSGALDGIILLAHEVSEQVAARREVERSQSRLSHMFSHNLVGTITWTMDGRVLDANDAFLRSVGYTREDLAAGNVDWRFMTPKAFAASDDERVRELREVGFHAPYEKAYVHKQGFLVPVLVSSAVFPDDPQGGFAYVVDLTDVKRAEQRLGRLHAAAAALAWALTTEQVSSVLLTHAREALGILDGGVYSTASDGSLRLEARLHGGAGPDALHDVLARAITGREPVWDDGAPFEVAEGSREVVRIAIPLVAGGSVLGAAGLIVPRATATSEEDRRFLLALAAPCAQALARARLFDAERGARQAAEEASRAKDEFLATVSHELRTPLNAMLGWARLLRGGGLDEPKRARALEIIERNAIAQAQLIEDLLDVSRITSGKLRLDVQNVEPVSIVAAAMDAVRPAVEAKGLHLTSDLPSNVGPLRADPQRLQQVVWNLLSNATKFTAAGGHVHVTLRASGSFVELEVEDDGRGIPRPFLARAFDRFTQADGSTTRTQGGLGLGLAITRHIVELHGGSVAAFSEGEGKGARFLVRLPRQALEGGPKPPLRLRGDAAEASAFGIAKDLAGRRVLVVDDEAEARELLATMLASSGAEVTVLGSANEALEALRHGRYDVLISDIGMPEEDGYALLQRVRALPKDQGGAIPAAALTAYASADDRRRALLAGFHMHLPKPVEPSELVAVVANLAGIADAMK